MARRKKASDKLRDMETPTVLGYELNRETLTPKREAIDLSRKGDHGADPMGDGKFRMVPSGDIVDFEERNKRLGNKRGGRTHLGKAAGGKVRKRADR